MSEPTSPPDDPNLITKRGATPMRGDALGEILKDCKLVEIGEIGAFFAELNGGILSLFVKIRGQGVVFNVTTTSLGAKDLAAKVLIAERAMTPEDRAATIRPIVKSSSPRTAENGKPLHKATLEETAPPLTLGQRWRLAKPVLRSILFPTRRT